MASKRVTAFLRKLASMTKIHEEQLRIVRAPGRANLIGEHTDYNEGYVLPCAVNKDVIIAAQPHEDEVVLYSMYLNATTRFSVRNIRFNPQERCGHVIYENERVLETVDALRGGELDKFGNLMRQSHESCRSLYEISCNELNLMVKIAEAVDGVVGCRMTGAGLGGCTVNLVWNWAVKELSQKISKRYKEKTGIKPEIYICDIPDRTGELRNYHDLAS